MSSCSSLPLVGAPIRVAHAIKSLLQNAMEQPCQSDAFPPQDDESLSDLSDLTPVPSEDEDDASFSADDDVSEDERPAKRSRRVIRSLQPFPIPAVEQAQRIVPLPPPLPHPIPTVSTSTLPANDALPSAKKRKSKTPAQKRARHARQHENRKEQRAAALAANGGVKAISLKRQAEAVPLSLPAFDAAGLPAARGAWVGKNQCIRPVKRDLAAVKEAGVEVVPWEGAQSHPVLDCEGRMFMFLAAGSREENWSMVAEGAARRIEKGRKCMRFKKSQVEHVRGPFPATATGISHGGGTEGPVNVRNTQRNQKIMDDLLNSPELRAIAGHNERIFQVNNPALHEHYGEVLGFVTDNAEGVRRTYLNSVFAATTINWGPGVICFDHADAHNLPYGWCRVTALGKFDPKKGGHLVLWDLGIAFEFPPGASIFLPSAILLHSNVAIQQGETRYSVTSYSAGGLFRWAWNGGRTDLECEEEFGKEAAMKRRAEHAVTAWEEALQYFPVWQA